ncbi:hypothetical protein ACF3M2_12375 [Tissierella carlieri]|uniref:hypothetical protein n=1 Tax=Tissierella carlieri TaxID=689904 RepID=UPI00386AFA47
MPRVGITAYDLLISCPGDVIEYLDEIKASVENFNRIFGVLNNIEVVTKHWSTDSYPQSGDKPQKLLNEQFVRDCDAVIAIFWTRFGTPTDKYGSGTEEEIEEMLLAKKQVFMYFLDAPINPSQVDMEQYKKIKDFKDKYKDKGIYAIIKDKHELQREFTNHLAMHFLPLISGEKVPSSESMKPILQIRDANSMSEESVYLFNTNLCDSKFIKDKKEAIVNKIHIIQSNKFSPRTSVVPKEKDYDETKDTPDFIKSINMKMIMQNTKFPLINEDAEIREDWKKTIIDFGLKNNIAIDYDFWNVGNLKKRISTITTVLGGGGTAYDGTEEEKNRYNLLRDLYWEVIAYNEYGNYFSYIDKLSFVKCEVSNIGNSFDEDIDVKLIIPKGYLLNCSDLPYPGMNIIEELLDMKFIDFMFTIKETESVEGYGYYPVSTSIYPDILNNDPFNKMSDSEKYMRNKRKYKGSIESIFNYKFFKNEEKDVMVFHIAYLKHNTSMAFPSIMMFTNIPEYMEYEITSKHIAEVIKGRIEFRKK